LVTHTDIVGHTNTVDILQKCWSQILLVTQMFLIPFLRSISWSHKITATNYTFRCLSLKNYDALLSTHT
jgi:hypothetical protein